MRFKRANSRSSAARACFSWYLGYTHQRMHVHPHELACTQLSTWRAACLHERAQTHNPPPIPPTHTTHSSLSKLDTRCIMSRRRSSSSAAFCASWYSSSSATVKACTIRKILQTRIDKLTNGDAGCRSSSCTVSSCSSSTSDTAMNVPSITCQGFRRYSFGDKTYLFCCCCCCCCCCNSTMVVVTVVGVVVGVVALVEKDKLHEVDLPSSLPTDIAWRLTCAHARATARNNG